MNGKVRPPFLGKETETRTGPSGTAGNNISNVIIIL